MIVRAKILKKVVNKLSDGSDYAWYNFITGDEVNMRAGCKLEKANLEIGDNSELLLEKYMSSNGKVLYRILEAK